ncbi:MAG: T9SS type B sorting domain-containing protein, partial [Bacteroidia bacterium]|nr:T9SS type B sorting domain-containing protein [Bacteroidia bacterium]
MIKSIYTFVLFLLLSKSSLSQFGKDGELTISTGTNIINQYTSISNNISIGQNTISVTSITDLNVPTNLTCGDLIIIYQAQGANMTTTDNSLYGNIVNYNSAGLFEYRHVVSVNGNTITLNAPLNNNYLLTGHPQVVKVPQYTKLTINSGAIVTGLNWDGSKGGIVSIHCSDSLILNGQIKANDIGFRGGKTRITSEFLYNGINYVSSVLGAGGEKGESICGYTLEYISTGGSFCRGAPGNGGGGGIGNSGGGGGANASNGNVYNGAGIMCSTCTGSSAWTKDADYIANGNSLTNSSGGGRGGNSGAAYNANALIDPPGSAAWGSDRWRNVGGRGGKPLTNINSIQRVYFGGGGGAGDANNNAGSNGGNGGGLIYLITPKIVGTGTISANGGNAAGSHAPHDDGQSGGGGGGSIILNCDTIYSSVFLSAKGGEGGRIIANTVYITGPGGGGGGGFISKPFNSIPSTDISGGKSGFSVFSWVSEFPVNAATDGASGLVQSIPVFTVITNVNVNTSSVAIASVSSNSICSGESVTIIPSGSSSYSLSPGNNTGNSFTVNPTITTTYTINALNSCNTSYTTVTINVAVVPPLSSPNQTICSGQTATLTASGATSYTWSENNIISNSITVSPNTTSIYTVTGSNGTSCTSIRTLTVDVINTPSLTINSPTICAGETTTLNVTGATNYTWSSSGIVSNPFTSSLVVSPTITTNYSVTGTNMACSNQTVTTLYITPMPTLSITGNTIVCPGQTATLTASGATTYTWSTGGNSSSINVNPTLNTTYTVIGAVNDCISQTYVSVNTRPNITVGGNTLICSGQTTTLTASGASNYTWTNSSSPSNPSGSVVIDSPNSTTNYTVTGNMNSCITSAVISVSVNSTPTISAISFTNTSCGLNNGSITITSLPSTNTYSWSSGIISTSNIINNLASGNYTVTAINGTCETSTLISVSGSLPLVILASTVTPSDCGSNNGSISVIDNQINSIYTWSPSISSTLNSINNLAPGNYSLTIINGSCATSTTFSIGLIGGPSGLDVIIDNTLCKNTDGSIQITNVINGTAPYLFSLNNSGFISATTYNNLSQGNYTVTVKDNLGCTYSQILSIQDTTINTTIDFLTNAPNCYGNDGSFIIHTINGGTFPYFISFNNNIYSTNTIFENLSSGTYSLSVKDSNNCETGFILTMPKNTGDYTLYIPNTFTANNDKVNDIWYVYGTCLGNFHCYIYNRWGEMIKELNNIQEGWDGTYKGNSVPEGVYTYLIEVEVYDKIINKSGHITLFR